MRALFCFWCFIIFFNICSFTINAQNLDRISIAPAGFSNNRMSATIGETFVLPLNNDNILLSLGSQSDNSNTGGILSIVNHLEIENFKVVVFPNPVKEFLSIKIWGLKNDTFIIEVSEISGKSLLHYSISNITDIFKINISSFVSGFYLLNIYSIKGEKIASTKFIKI